MIQDKPTQNLFLLIFRLVVLLGLFFSLQQLLKEYGPRSNQQYVSEDILSEFEVGGISREIIPADQQEEFGEILPQAQIEQTLPGESSFENQEGSNPEITQQITEIAPQVTPTPIPTPTVEWMTYDSIDFNDSEVEILFSLDCDEDQIYFEKFRVVPYEPGILESDAYTNNFEFSVAWEHLGYYGLWIHSGVSHYYGALTAYPLQMYLENDDNGYLLTVDEFNKKVDNCLIGSIARLKQDELISDNQIIAAVRIPPNEVSDLDSHVMELVPYLAEKYPDSGFDKMNAPGLITTFCGRQLNGENQNPDLDYWTQARIIIGAMPTP